MDGEEETQERAPLGKGQSWRGEANDAKKCGGIFLPWRGPHSPLARHRHDKKLLPEPLEVQPIGLLELLA